MINTEGKSQKAGLRQIQFPSSKFMNFSIYESMPDINKET